MTTTLLREHVRPSLIPPENRARDDGYWRRAYASRLAVTDVCALVWAISGAALLTGATMSSLDGPEWIDRAQISYLWVGLLLLGAWTLALAGVGSRGYRVIGVGTSEYKAVLQSTAAVLLVLALLAFALQINFSRGFVLVALPAGLVALLISRALWRQWLQLHRQCGHYCSRVLLVGSGTTALRIAADLRRVPGAGYNVVGAVITDDTRQESLLGDIPVLGSVDGLLDAVYACRADTVFVTDGHNLPPQRLRQLSWSLEPGRQHLVMAPSLTDVAGPRIHARPVAGLPLVHVETPRYEGTDRVAKRAFDFCASGGLLLVMLPALLVIAGLVKCTSKGGVFFSHERIGKHGRPFRMLKFRSMAADADSRLDALLREQGTNATPLFKVQNDPRITRVGQFLRRYSIDELPQLFNVLRGEMSLVGPRPQVAKEVALYDPAASRRLFVKPGMTGLWQVSGRSNLGWDESVRLDLYYVENWSMTADLAILFRTVKAVLAKDGAV